jgi:hypothetical protein
MATARTEELWLMRGDDGGNPRQPCTRPYTAMRKETVNIALASTRPVLVIQSPTVVAR